MIMAPDGIVTGREVEPRIRGVLLLIIVWLGLIDPLYSAALNTYVAAQTHQSDPDWTYILVRAAMRIGAASALIFFRRPGAVWFALAMLWISGPVYVVVNWALYDNQVMPLALIRSAAVATACTLYFLRSKRVRATYNFRLKPGDPERASLKQWYPDNVPH